MSKILLCGILVLTVFSQISAAANAGPCPPPLSGDYRCWNVTLPQDHSVTTTQPQLITTLVGYDATQAGNNGEQVTVVLSEGCQFQNAEWMSQWEAYTKIGQSATYNNALVFTQPRGSGWGTDKDVIMCPDDVTGQNMIPSAQCASGYVKQNNINQYYNLWQMANDLQTILGQIQNVYGSSPTIRIVAADVIGNAWVQKWQMLFPKNNAAGGTVQYIVLTSPPALERYDLVEALVENPENNVRTVLAQCGLSPKCAKYFGGADVNQVLVEVMKSARQNQLPCNDAINNAWNDAAMGPKPDPFFRFYSDLFGMLLRNPVDAFGYWDQKLAALIPGVLYRIQRCNSGDVTALTTLYTNVRNLAQVNKTVNEAGSQRTWSKCYISPVVRWSIVFNNLLMAAHTNADDLLDPENDNVVLPATQYVKDVVTTYTSWPATVTTNNKKTGYAQSNIAFQILVGGVNPLVKTQQTLYAAGQNYDLPRTLPASPTTMTSFGSGPFFDAAVLPTGNHMLLYTAEEYNGGLGFSCAIAAVWSLNVNQTLAPCITTYGELTQFDFSGEYYPTQQAFQAYMGTTKSFDRGTDGPLAPPKTNPPASLIQTPQPEPPTPLPPGETYAPPTPLPPGETYAPPTPEPVYNYSTSGHESITITGTDNDDIHVHISIGGLVAAILGGVIFLVLLVVCVGKCVQRRMNDPAKRDFYREVYGNQGNATSLNSGQENIYRNV